MPAVALLRRHRLAIRRLLPRALAGHRLAVHRLRVSTRRLRELLPVLAPAAPAVDAGRIRRFARTLTRSFGPVRELDVARSLFDALSEAAGGGTRGLRRALEREAARRRRALLAQMSSVDVAARLDDVTALSRAVESEAFAREAPALLAARLLSRAAGLESAIEAAGSLYDATRLHQVRIAAKKLRYALELAGELGAGGVKGDLRRLKRMQDLLGALHDLEVLASHARTFQARRIPAARRTPGVARFVQRLDQAIRARHARYLRTCGQMTAVIAHARRLGEALADLGLRRACRPDSPGPFLRRQRVL